MQMQRKPIGWRRWIVSIGFFAFGLMFLAMAAGAFTGGLAIVPGKRNMNVRPHVTRIESPAMRVVTGSLFSIVGLVLVRLGYRALRDRGDSGP